MKYIMSKISTTNLPSLTLLIFSYYEKNYSGMINPAVSCQNSNQVL